MMDENLKKVLRPMYYWTESRLNFILGFLFPSRIKDYKRIPIIINNRNRLTFLLQLLNNLEIRGYSNIYIIDNNSSYPPLLEYYKKCQYHIFRLDSNVGHLALWKTKIYKRFIKDFYVYTDPDVVPIEECPNDFLSFFMDTLKKYRFVQKVGFSLKIDDLPDYFSKKEEVIKWERHFFETKADDKLYLAHVDTTFALYRPWAWNGANYYHQTFRTAHPYSARHMPWYVDSSNLTEEEHYYIEHSETSTHWTKKE
jgi:hypothetical protein